MSLNTKQKQYIDKHHRRQNASRIARTLNLPEDEVKEYIARTYPRRPLSRNAKVLFSIITLSIPILFFLVLELSLRMADYGGDLDLFVFPEQYDGKYGMLNHHYHDKFFFQTTTFEAGRGNVFLKEKPGNGFRVFVLGASTAESFPYGHNGVFSLIVRDMLDDVLPERHVEVVNIGITATNTYTLYDQVGEVLKYEPDAVMIYSGQNEFYGALGIASSENMGGYPGLVRFSMNLYRFRTFLLLRDAIGWVSDQLTGFDKREVPGTLMQRMAQQHAIPLDSKMYEAGKRQYESNLNAILQIYRKNDVPVFISSLVSNLKDQPPFYSIETDDHPAASEIYERALAEYEAGRYDEAVASFRYARDLDAIRFRAPSSFNEIIREKARKHDAYYIPMKERMTSQAENGVIGSDFMLEHLHPNSDGYFLMGKTFFEQLMEADLPGLHADMSRLREPDYYREAMHLTELDHRMVWHRIQGLMNSWPFVDESDPQGYPANYSPDGIADRLAFDYVREYIRWEEAKTRMAQWYNNNNRYEEAIMEVMGAIRAVPHEEEAWRFAGHLAMQAEKTGEAVDFLMQAYHIKPTNHTCRTMGMIEFDRENFERAADYLKEAYQLDPRDHQSLFNASVAHASNEQYEQAWAITEELTRTNPDYPGLQGWRAHLQQAVSRGGSME